MENLTPEQIQQVVNRALIYCDIAFYVFLAFLTFMGICALIKTFKQDKYLQTLNEHDAYVVARYTHTKIFERRKKHNPSNSNNSNNSN